MIVVCVEAIPEVAIARIRSLSQGEPRTSPASAPRIASSSSKASTAATPAKATTATATAT